MSIPARKPPRWRAQCSTSHSTSQRGSPAGLPPRPSTTVRPSITRRTSASAEGFPGAARRPDHRRSRRCSGCRRAPTAGRRPSNRRDACRRSRSRRERTRWRPRSRRASSGPSRGATSRPSRKASSASMPIMCSDEAGHSAGLGRTRSARSGAAFGVSPGALAPTFHPPTGPSRRATASCTA